MCARSRCFYPCRPVSVSCFRPLSAYRAGCGVIGLIYSVRPAPLSFLFLVTFFSLEISSFRASEREARDRRGEARRGRRARRRCPHRHRRSERRRFCPGTAPYLRHPLRYFSLYPAGALSSDLLRIVVARRGLRARRRCPHPHRRFLSRYCPLPPRTAPFAMRVLVSLHPAAALSPISGESQGWEVCFICSMG